MDLSLPVDGSPDTLLQRKKDKDIRVQGGAYTFPYVIPLRTDKGGGTIDSDHRTSTIASTTERIVVSAFLLHRLGKVGCFVPISFELTSVRSSYR